MIMQVELAILSGAHGNVQVDFGTLALGRMDNYIRKCELHSWRSAWHGWMPAVYFYFLFSEREGVLMDPGGFGVDANRGGLGVRG